MTKFKVLILLAISAMLTWNTFASTIDRIEAIINNTIELSVSSDVLFSDVKVEWEVKLLKDIPVSFSNKDLVNQKKILLNLSTDLTANTLYSLITILWAEGNIDFAIWDYLGWEIKNPNYDETQSWIEKINVIDSRTIELYYNTDLVWDVFEFKILSDINLSSMKSEWNNILKLESTKNLEKSTDYIVMILTLKDVMWNEIMFDEDLYDFTTPAELVKAVPEEEIVLAAAPEEEVVVDKWNIEEVALTIEETPETWTATSILVVLAIILNLAFFLRKKFVK